MIERVVDAAGRLRRHRRGALARLPARRVPRGLPRRHLRRRRAALRRRARAARHRRSGALRRARRRHRRTPSWWSTATCSPTSTSARSWDFHRRSGAEGTIALTPVDDPSRYRRRPDRRRRSGRGLRREAAARRGAHQLDQRRHLRARAGGARPHPRRPTVSIERVDLPRDGRRRQPLRHALAMPTGSTPAHPPPTCRPSSTSSTGAGGRPRPAWPRRRRST